ncbi:NUDIX hydrolase [Wenyingzhuangia sp. IMCC45467]
MEFNYLCNHIDLLVKMTLPGIDAHKTLSPIQRPLFTKYNIPDNAKKAGVLVLLYPNKEQKTTLLLTKRAQYKGTHSNQISFPGGKKNPEDVDLKNTAIRETYEEVGLAQTDLKIHKQLSSIYIPPSNFKVNSYLATIPYTPVFTKNYEVDEIIHITIEELLNNNNLTTFKTATSYANNIEVPCFMFNKHCVWGATAMILSEVKEVLKNL